MARASNDIIRYPLAGGAAVFAICDSVDDPRPICFLCLRPSSIYLINHSSTQLFKYSTLEGPVIVNLNLKLACSRIPNHILKQNREADVLCGI